MTIKPLRLIDADHQGVDTIRPIQRKPDVKPVIAASAKNRKPSTTTVPQRRKVSVKENPEQKFVLPSRPIALHRDPSVEDYSDLFIDNENENAFDRRLNIIRVGQMTRHTMLLYDTCLLSS
jgi:hypothetical protein